MSIGMDSSGEHSIGGVTSHKVHILSKLCGNLADFFAPSETRLSKIWIDNIYAYDVFMSPCWSLKTTVCMFCIARPESRFSITDAEYGIE